MNRKPVVLIICTGNSMRSQMAEGLLRHDLGHRIEVHSAGTHPSIVHPHAIRAMNEIGIDISTHTSKSVNLFTDKEIDLAITVCDSAREVCPVFPYAKKTVHVGYPDPVAPLNGMTIQETFAGIRDRMRVELKKVVLRELGLVE